jgi:hypothetical protein
MSLTSPSVHSSSGRSALASESALAGTFANNFMSHIINKPFMAFSTIGSVAQQGTILESVSEHAFLVHVTEQFGKDVDFYRICTLNEMINFRIYDKSYKRSSDVAEITEAYEKRVAEAEAKALTEKEELERAALEKPESSN